MRIVGTVFHYAFYAFVALCWYHVIQIQQENQQAISQMKEDSEARVNEEREEARQMIEKTNKFMNDTKHEVVIQIARNVHSMCVAQLDPNCEYLQSLVNGGQIKASELGITNKDITGLVQQYKARYAQYYANQGQ